MQSPKREKEIALIAQESNNEIMPANVEEKKAACNQETEKTAMMAQHFNGTPIKTNTHIMGTATLKTTTTATVTTPPANIVITEADHTTALQTPAQFAQLLTSASTSTLPVATPEATTSSSPPSTSSSLSPSLSLPLSTPSPLASSILQARLPAQQQQQPTTVAKASTMPQTKIIITSDTLATPNGINNNHNNHNTSSLKKKRNKSIIVKRIELESKSTAINGAAEKTKTGAAGAGVGGGVTLGGVGQSSIKTSLSMTSLPPDDEKQEGRDVIKAKLRVERPYNSLKKNADRSALQLRYATNFFGSPVGSSAGTSSTFGAAQRNKNKYNRYSWGSNSSSSLHGSAATLGFGLSGKDDLWAAIQTNYNYIMDTNLLDTCREARGEIEGAANVMESPIVGCFKLIDDDAQRSESFIEDPKNLRRWLREMEQKLEHSPSLSEATLFSIAELQRHLADHSVLYHEIVSHARVVSACIRAASEREQQQQQQRLHQPRQQQQQPTQQQPFNNISNAEQNYSSLSSTDTEQQQQQFVPGETVKSTAPTAVSSSSSSLSTTTTTTTTTTTNPATASKKSEGNLERLQNRYHLLYLKAFEVQLWLDGLLRKKTSNASVLHDDEHDDIDDDDDDDSSSVCDATEDDLNDDAVASELETDATQNSSSFCDLQRCTIENEADEDGNITKISIHNNKNTHHNNLNNKLHQLLQRDCIENKADCEDGDDEEEDDDEEEGDEIDCGQSRYSAVVVTADGNTYDKSGNIGQVLAPTTTLTDFEADSESSDLETINSVRRQRRINDFRYVQQQQQPAPPAKVPPQMQQAAAAAAATITTVNNISSLKTTAATKTPATSPNTKTTTTREKTVAATNCVSNLVSNNTNNNNYTSSSNSNITSVNRNNNIHRYIESNLSSNVLRRNTLTMHTKINSSSNNVVGLVDDVGVSVDAGVDVGVGLGIGIGNGHVVAEEQQKQMMQQQQQQLLQCNSNKQCVAAQNNTVTTTTTTTCTTATQTQQLLLQQMQLLPPTREHQQQQKQQQPLQLQPDHQPQQQQQIQLLRTPQKAKNIAIISPNCHNNNNNNTGTSSNNSTNNNNTNFNTKSPPALRKRQQHQRHVVDVSKFNRSNRKSKNCAIFYFKHLDTDNETNYGGGDDDDDDHGDAGGGDVAGRDDCGASCGLSSSASNASDLIKSAEASSDDDDEGWLYSATLKSTADRTAGTADNSFNCCVQSSTVSSSSTSSTKSSSAAAAAAASKAKAATNNDYAKEVINTANALVLTTTTTATADLHFNCTVTTTATAAAAAATTSSSKTISVINSTSSDGKLVIGSCSGSCSDNSVSGCSSNDLLTETTTTTATTATSQITQMHLQRASDMDVKLLQQINGHVSNNSGNSGNNNNNNNNTNISRSNGLIANGRNHDAAVDDGDGDENDNAANCSKQQNINEMNDQTNFKNGLQRQHNQQNQHQQQQQQLIFVADSNGNMAIEGKCVDGGTEHLNGSRSCCYYTRADINNIIVKSNDTFNSSSSNNNNNNNSSYNNNNNHQKQQQQQLLNPVKNLPPRSPAKSATKTNKSTTVVMNGSDTLTNMSPTKQLSHESIKQLVLEAEHLVRDEALKTPAKPKHSLIKISSTVKKREVIMPGPIKQRVQEWLEHQPSTPMPAHKSREPPSPSSSPNNVSASASSGGLNDTSLINARPADDCEASGEASETDSVHHPPAGSDTSDGLTDSIATCMQTSTNSFGRSIERIGGSAEPIVGHGHGHGHGNVLGYGSSNQSLNASVVKIVKRQQIRRKSERPWSVSCLSQLTTENAQVATKATEASNVQAGLASHSISESALDSLSPGRRPRASSTSVTHVRQQIVRNYDCKGSLKRRKTRRKKLCNVAQAAAAAAAVATYSGSKKISSDSGSEESAELMPKLTQSMLMKSCETMSAQQIQEITNALLSLQKSSISSMVETAVGSGCLVAAQMNSGAPSGQTKQQLQQQQQQQQLQHQHQQLAQQGSGGEEESPLMKPNFRVGSYTTAYMTSEARLGPLAALATYMNDEEQQGAYTTGTEENHSSFSETAWDNYQEKYNSENYSEGLDSDAARRLLEFGDDYRNFIDSQSDCCSSLSAANNVDSLSPPRMDSLQQNEQKIISQETIVSSVDHARRRRALELEYERRRKSLEVRRKSCQDNSDNQHQIPSRSPTATNLSSSAHALTSSKTSAAVENPVVLQHHRHISEATSRKLDFGMSHSAQSLRRTSESDTSTRRRKVDERRRSSRNLEKCIKLIPANTSSSSCDDSEDEKEVRNLLTQSRMRLEDTRSLKIRCHLLRPEDYNEIINTCRDNIRCLEAVLRGPPSTVLSPACANQSKDLLAAWEDLLGWSENAAAARKLQEEMIVLKHTLHRLGNKSSFELLDTEPSIQIAIEALKNEKTQLQTYRTQMLRLNASVHSWLTRQERKLQAAVEEAAGAATAATIAAVPSIEAKIDNSVTNVMSPETTAEQQQPQQQVATAVLSVDHNQINPIVDEIIHAVNIGTSTSGGGGSASSAAELKATQLETLVHSESEFHKHLKDEVSDMYSAWDEADARINNQLEVLTTSLIAWRQLECGLSEFQQVLGKDRGTLKGLEGALNKGHATPIELAQNVKLVAKLLSEKVNVSQEQLTAVQEHLDPNHIVHITKFTASNGSLSDSGISDGGATSDGGLSERERRLGVLRRLAKQLESALAPGSEAMKSIAARMESAEAELKHLQNTCRDLIVRTAATHQNKKQLLENQLMEQAQDVADFVGNGVPKTNGSMLSPPSPNKMGRRNKRREHKPRDYTHGAGAAGATDNHKANKRAGNQKVVLTTAAAAATAPDGGDDPASDPDLEFELDKPADDAEKPRKIGWAWRIAKAALPMQMALFTFLCAACLMQPNCCDNLNNFSMSFTPQLRYIRGPPPI